jgi:alkylated DNA repair dioxygenase AlkB
MAETLLLSSIHFCRDSCQAILNVSECGEGISAHIDYPNFGECIACMTFDSGADIVFTRETKNNDKQSQDMYALYTCARSLYVMTGSARHESTHEMKPDQYDTVEGARRKRGRRMSVTFREVKSFWLF